MTPKEKAEELMNKMFGLDLEDITKFDYIDHVAAKHFALIAVDEILDLKHIVTLRRNIHEMELEYWMEVKQEIEAL